MALIFTELSENEVLDDLQINNLFLIQRKDLFKFGTDAVLLSDWASGIVSEETLDLCTGSAVVPILMSAKTETPHFCAVEIQQSAAECAKKSVLYNNLENRIEIFCADLLNSVSIFGKRRFDLITCNPPYMKANSAILNSADSKTIARHEITCSLEDIIRVSADLLTTTGHLCMVHRPSRLADLIYLMRKYNIEPKRLRIVHSKSDSEPVLVLIEGRYGGKSELKVLPPLILYNDDGSETEELRKIYNRGC